MHRRPRLGVRDSSSPAPITVPHRARAGTIGLDKSPERQALNGPPGRWGLQLDPRAFGSKHAPNHHPQASAIDATAATFRYLRKGLNGSDPIAHRRCQDRIANRQQHTLQNGLLSSATDSKLTGYIKKAARVVETPGRVVSSMSAYSRRIRNCSACARSHPILAMSSRAS
jgi:hypothetical protein